MLRTALRWFLTAFVGACLLAIAFGVVGEFFIELARAKGLYENPSQKVDSVMAWFEAAKAAIVGSPYFWFPAGGVAVLWLDRVLRRRAESDEGRLDDAAVIEANLVFTWAMLRYHRWMPSLVGPPVRQVTYTNKMLVNAGISPIPDFDLSDLRQQNEVSSFIWGLRSAVAHGGLAKARRVSQALTIITSTEVQRCRSQPDIAAETPP